MSARIEKIHDIEGSCLSIDDVIAELQRLLSLENHRRLSRSLENIRQVNRSLRLLAHLFAHEADYFEAAYKRLAQRIAEEPVEERIGELEQELNAVIKEQTTPRPVLPIPEEGLTFSIDDEIDFINLTDLEGGVE